TPERDARALELATEQAGLPFDLSRGPLIRVCLVRLADSEYLFVLTMHHIITDGWSMGIFFKEMNALYAAFIFGASSPLGELPIPYADFAVWQRDWLRGEVLERQIGYWREQLADLPLLKLPTDHPRPPIQTYSGAYQSVEFDKELSTALTELGHREEATLF